MLPTIILLYALNASTPIPVGCFIAAWVLFALEIVRKIFKILIDD